MKLNAEIVYQVFTVLGQLNVCTCTYTFMLIIWYSVECFIALLVWERLIFVAGDRCTHGNIKTLHWLRHEESETTNVEETRCICYGYTWVYKIWPDSSFIF